MEIRLNVVPTGVSITPQQGEGKDRCLACGRVMGKGVLWAEAWCDEHLLGYVCQDCPELQEQTWIEAMREDSGRRIAHKALLDHLLGDMDIAVMETLVEDGTELYSAGCVVKGTLYPSLSAGTVLDMVRMEE